MGSPSCITCSEKPANAAARTASLEIDARGAEDDHVLAIESLGNYIERHTAGS